MIQILFHQLIHSETHFRSSETFILPDSVHLSTKNYTNEAMYFRNDTSLFLCQSVFTRTLFMSASILPLVSDGCVRPLFRCQHVASSPWLMDCGMSDLRRRSTRCDGTAASMGFSFLRLQRTPRSPSRLTICAICAIYKSS